MREQYRFVPPEVEKVDKYGYCKANACEQEKRKKETH